MAINIENQSSTNESNVKHFKREMESMDEESSFRSWKDVVFALFIAVLAVMTINAVINDYSYLLSDSTSTMSSRRRLPENQTKRNLQSKEDWMHFQDMLRGSSTADSKFEIDLEFTLEKGERYLFQIGSDNDVLNQHGQHESKCLSFVSQIWDSDSNSWTPINTDPRSVTIRVDFSEQSFTVSYASNFQRYQLYICPPHLDGSELRKGIFNAAGQIDKWQQLARIEEIKKVVWGSGLANSNGNLNERDLKQKNGWIDLYKMLTDPSNDADSEFHIDLEFTSGPHKRQWRFLISSDRRVLSGSEQECIKFENTKWDSNNKKWIQMSTKLAIMEMDIPNQAFRLHYEFEDELFRLDINLLDPQHVNDVCKLVHNGSHNGNGNGSDHEDGEGSDHGVRDGSDSIGYDSSGDDDGSIHEVCAAIKMEHGSAR